MKGVTSMKVISKKKSDLISENISSALTCLDLLRYNLHHYDVTEAATEEMKYQSKIAIDKLLEITRILA